MMKAPAIFYGMFFAGPAAAHTGHLADLAGHDHWVAGIAVGAAVVVGVWGALKGKSNTEDQIAEDAPDEAEPREG